MAGKTAQRILATALTLFNEKGENCVTSVDIALELDISPGNLYYHFKGKEQIINALVQWQTDALTPVLNPANMQKLHAEDFFYFLALVLEQLQLFRFLYRSPADLSEKYPRIKRWHQRQVKQIDLCLLRLLQQFSADNCLVATSSEQRFLVDLVTMILVQSHQFDDLKDNNDAKVQVFHALSLIMTALLPRFKLQPSTIAQLRKAIEHHSLANLLHQGSQKSEDAI